MPRYPDIYPDYQIDQWYTYDRYSNDRYAGSYVDSLSSLYSSHKISQFIDGELVPLDASFGNEIALYEGNTYRLYNYQMGFIPNTRYYYKDYEVNEYAADTNIEFDVIDSGVIGLRNVREEGSLQFSYTSYVDIIIYDNETENTTDGIVGRFNRPTVLALNINFEKWLFSGPTGDEISRVYGLRVFEPTYMWGGDAPVAVPDFGSDFTSINNEAIIPPSVIINDFDPEGFKLEFLGFDTSLTKGSIVDLGGGTFQYDPGGQFDYLAPGQVEIDYLSYHISDGYNTSTGTVEIIVAGPSCESYIGEYNDLVADLNRKLLEISMFEDQIHFLEEGIGYSNVAGVFISAYAVASVNAQYLGGIAGAFAELAIDAVDLWNAKKLQDVIIIGGELLSSVSRNIAEDISKGNAGVRSLEYLGATTKHLLGVASNLGIIIQLKEFVDLRADLEIRLSNREEMLDLSILEYRSIYQKIIGMEGDLVRCPHWMRAEYEKDPVQALNSLPEILGNREIFSATSADDSFVGFSVSDEIRGGKGSDTIFGRSGDDTIYGQSGDDKLIGNVGSDELVGGSGRDTLLGERGADSLKGGRHTDFLQGGAGQDRLFGQGGSDVIRGGGGADRLFGGSASDDVIGGRGNDRLIGGNGNDVLRGGGGDDVLFGGRGSDLMIGGGGRDTFVFAGRDTGSDVLRGFSQDRDKLKIVSADSLDDLVIRQRGADAIILHDAGRIVLKNQSADDLSATDFIGLQGSSDLDRSQAFAIEREDAISFYSDHIL